LAQTGAVWRNPPKQTAKNMLRNEFLTVGLDFDRFLLTLRSCLERNGISGYEPASTSEANEAACQIPAKTSSEGFWHA